MTATHTNGKGNILFAIQLLGAVAAVATPLVLMYAELTAIQIKLGEVETQFHARDQYDNVKLAQDQRTFSLLWEAVFPGSHYPTEAIYYPSIAKPR